jgi:hypothetical protein
MKRSAKREILLRVRDGIVKSKERKYKRNNLHKSLAFVDTTTSLPVPKSE